jgi:hypothetical protein
VGREIQNYGHGSLIISDDSGNIIFVSDPAPGCDHDMKKLEGAVKEILDLAGCSYSA